MKYYDVEFNNAFLERYDFAPRKNIIHNINDNKKAYDIVTKYMKKKIKDCVKEARGCLRYPYLVPGGTHGDLWDWDSFFMACAAPEDAEEAIKGSIANLLENCGLDGRPTKKFTYNGEIEYAQHPYPLSAQFVYVVAKRFNDFKWAEQYWEKLVKIQKWYEENCMRNGYFVWLGMYGNGIDNNPAVYGRAEKTSAGIDLAVWHYRDYKAMEKLAHIFNKKEELEYRLKAEKLKSLICEKYFDECDRRFYNIDCSTNYSCITMQGVNWVTHLKFKNWATLFPLWGKTVTDTLGYGALNIVLSMVFSILLALLLFEVSNKKALKYYQTTMMLPTFLSWVIIGYITYIFLSPESGILNSMIKLFGGEPLKWYSDPKYWPWIIPIVNIWKGVGMGSIMYYASLVGVDSAIFEAAEIDGASKLQKIQHISIPSLVPIATIMLIMNVGGIIKGDFGLFYQIPRDIGILYPATDIIETYIFRGLKGGNMAISTAVGLVQSVVGLLMVVTTNAIVTKIDPDKAMF